MTEGGPAAPGPSAGRGSRALGNRGVLVSSASTVLFFAIIAVVVVLAPGGGLAQRADLHGLRSLYPDPGPCHSRGQGDTRARVLTFQAGRRGVHGPLQGSALAPGSVHDRVRRAWP